MTIPLDDLFSFLDTHVGNDVNNPHVDFVCNIGERHYSRESVKVYLALDDDIFAWAWTCFGCLGKATKWKALCVFCGVEKRCFRVYNYDTGNTAFVCGSCMREAKAAIGSWRMVKTLEG